MKIGVVIKLWQIVVRPAILKVAIRPTILKVVIISAIRLKVFFQNNIYIGLVGKYDITISKNLSEKCFIIFLYSRP